MYGLFLFLIKDGSWYNCTCSAPLTGGDPYTVNGCYGKLKSLFWTNSMRI